jgi:hypothetical protein
MPCAAGLPFNRIRPAPRGEAAFVPAVEVMDAGNAAPRRRRANILLTQDPTLTAVRAKKDRTRRSWESGGSGRVAL